MVDGGVDEFFLAHYGIPGMKWGVRRTPEQLGRKRGEVLDKSMLGLSRRDQKNWEKYGTKEMMNRTRGQAKLRKETATVLKELKKKYKEPNEEYYLEVSRRLANISNQHLNRSKGAEVRLIFSVGRNTTPGAKINSKSPERTLYLMNKQVYNLETQRARIRAKSSQMRHAETEEVHVYISFDSEGWIVDAELEDDAIEQSAIAAEFVDDVLEHYGIPGMKWGVRRTPEQLGRKRGSRESRPKREKKPDYSSKARARRQKQLTEAEMQQLIQRVKLEKELAALKRAPEKERGSAETKKWAKQLAKDSVANLVKSASGEAGKALVKYALQQALEENKK